MNLKSVAAADEKDGIFQSITTSMERAIESVKDSIKSSFNHLKEMYDKMIVRNLFARISILNPNIYIKNIHILKCLK